MLMERYDLSGEGAVINDDNLLLGDCINSRKSYFTKLNRTNSEGRNRNIRGGSYRRGNVFSNQGFSQRVVVKAHFKRHGYGGDSAGNLRSHLGYITRDGAGINEERPSLFGSVSGIDGGLTNASFYNLCKDDRHHFRIIISPENGHEVEDFEKYIRTVMGRVEKDLDTKLKWVSSVHYDTDHVHAHVVLRGKDDDGKDLVISPDYISHGIRGVAQEVITKELGERSLAEMERSMAQEVDALRVTSLDRYIESRAKVVEVEVEEVHSLRISFRDLSRNERDVFRMGLVKKRLAFLATTSMAHEESKGVYLVRSNFTKELRDVSEKHDIIKQLHRSMPDEESKLNIYRSEEWADKNLQGRIEKIANVNELTDHKYMVIRDGDEERHYVRLSESVRSDELEEGQIVEVRAPKNDKYRYPFVKALSSKPIDSQIDANARTFLDLEIYRHQKGYDLSYAHADKATLDGISKRKDWLVENGYASYEGEEGAFTMRGDALGKLYDAEIEGFGIKMLGIFRAQGIREIDLEDEENIKVKFVGRAHLHAGEHILIENDGFLSVVKSDLKNIDWIGNEPLNLAQTKEGLSINRIILDKSKEEALESFAKHYNVSYDQDFEAEIGDDVLYAGSVHLKSGAYMAVVHDDDLCLVKTKDYLVYEHGQELSIKSKEDSFVDVEEVSVQKEIELDNDDWWD